MSRRVNVSAAVRPDTKRKAEAIARLQNSSTSRIIDNVLSAFIERYEKANPSIDLLETSP